MKTRTSMFVALVVCLGLVTQAWAVAQFKKPFEEKYVENSDNEAFQKAFKKLSCNTCHIDDKKRDWVNAYGKALSELIPGNAKDRQDAAKEVSTEARKAEDEKLVAELMAAFEKVEALESPSGVTWGELLKSHMLPSAEGAESLRGNTEEAGDK
jgi:hypothetical protein